MKKRILSLVLALSTLILNLSLAGCGGKKASEIYFLNFKPESAAIYEEIAKKI